MKIAAVKKFTQVLVAMAVAAVMAALLCVRLVKICDVFALALICRQVGGHTMCAPVVTVE